MSYGFPLGDSQKNRADTPTQIDDSTRIATTEWTRDYDQEVSKNLTIFKCGAVNHAQSVTRYLNAVGTAANATEADTNIYFGYPVEIYGMKVYLSEAVPSSETLTVTLRKNAADTSLALTVTGATSAGYVASETGSVIYSRDDALSVKTVTSASFGSTNDISVTLLARIPNSNNKPVSSLALSSLGTVGDYAVLGEFRTTVDSTTAVNANLIDQGLFPTADVVLEAVYVYDDAPVLLDSSVATVKVRTRYAAGDDFFACTETTTTNADSEAHVVFSDRLYGNVTGVWSPMLFSSVNQAQATTLYMGGYGASTANATENAVKVALPKGKVRALRAYASDVVVPAGQSCVITVHKNGVATGLTVTLDNSNRYAANTAIEVQFSDNDLISLECVSSATAGTNTYHAVLELDRVD